MTQASKEKEQYLADFEPFGERVAQGEAPWLRALRQDAISRFTQVGFPTARRGNEEWKYTNVGPVARAVFRYPFQATSAALSAEAERHLDLGRDWARLAFVNGRYRADLSSVAGLPAGVRVGNLTEADPETLSGHLAQLAKLDGDGFIALSTAFIHDGALIALPAGEVVEQPIHLLYIKAEDGAEVVSYPRTLLLAGKGSMATVVESYVGPSANPYFTNAVTEIAVGEGANLNHYKLMLEGEEAYHVATAQVRQERDSVFRSTSIAIGGRLARNTLNVLLDAAGSQCTLDGLFLTSGTQHVDNHTFIDHAKPHTTSRELYKGILDGSSKAVFSGRVLVRRDAQKADAQQTNKNLVLSEGAEVDTKPQLEIFADDVKCSHGATAGKLEEESLFYLRARGLDKERARDLLAYAFAGEVLQRIDLQPVRDHVDRLLLRSLPTLQVEGQA